MARYTVNPDGSANIERADEVAIRLPHHWHLSSLLDEFLEVYVRRELTLACKLRDAIDGVPLKYMLHSFLCDVDSGVQQFRPCLF